MFATKNSEVVGGSTESKKLKKSDLKFSTGMYVLKVNQNNNQLKTFKIIKK